MLKTCRTLRQGTGARLTGLVLCALVVRPGSALAASISIVPVSSSVVVGETFSVDVSVADLDDLFSYQFDLALDPSALAASASVGDGGFLTSGGGVSLLGG